LNVFSTDCLPHRRLLAIEAWWYGSTEGVRCRLYADCASLCRFLFYWNGNLLFSIV
jgi:hypothetical protein